MQSTTWNKYKLIKEINNNSSIKTYLIKEEHIIKEIKYKNKNEYYLIRERIERIKDRIKIYDIIEEEERIYIVIENNNENIIEFDKLILLDKMEIKNENIVKEQVNPISKKEILNLLNNEKSMCKIIYEKYEDKKVKRRKGKGFFLNR